MIKELIPEILLLISLAWVLGIVFIPNTSKKAVLILSLIILLVHAILSLYLAIEVLYYDSVIKWVANIPFQLELTFTKLATTCLLTLNLLIGYFVVTELKKTGTTTIELKKSIIPYLGYSVGILFMAGANNLIVFFVGWIAASLGGFLAFVLKDIDKNIKAPLFFQLVSMEGLSRFLFLSAILIYSQETSVSSFESLSGAGFVVKLLLILGILSSSFQFPFCSNVLRISNLNKWATPFFILLSSAFVGFFFQKAPVGMFNLENFYWLILLTTLSALVLSILAFTKKNDDEFLSFILAYGLSSMVYLGIVGKASIVQVFLITNILQALILGMIIELREKNIEFSGPYKFLILLLFAGVPGTFFGWTRIEKLKEYVFQIIKFQSETPVEHYIILALGFIAEVLIFCAITRFLFVVYPKGKIQSPQNKDLASLILVLIFSVTSFFGLGLFPGYGHWLELNISIPYFNWLYNVLIESFPKTEEIKEYWSLVTNFIIITTVALINWLLFFRKKADERGFVSLLNLVRYKIYLDEYSKDYVWKYFINVPMRALSTSMIWIEDVFLFKLKNVVSSFLTNRGIDFFIQIEERFLRFYIVGLVVRTFDTLGRAIRLTHNGQIQFYLVFGLLVTFLIVYRFIKFGG